MREKKKQIWEKQGDRRKDVQIRGNEAEDPCRELKRQRHRQTGRERERERKQGGAGGEAVVAGRWGGADHRPT